MDNTNTQTRTKIGNAFDQSGSGRGTKKAPIYLIDGYAYARSLSAWRGDFNPLQGDLEGYVRVNYIESFGTFYEVSDTERSKHQPFADNSKNA